MYIYTQPTIACVYMDIGLTTSALGHIMRDSTLKEVDSSPENLI